MLEHVELFFKEHAPGEAPIILGYSGGVDSSALLYLLSEYHKRWGAELHIIHIDHGWRETSSQEALILQKQVEALKLPFYLEKIASIRADAEKNLEEKFRDERLKIFRKYYDKLQAGALILAHQKDDLAETVFKRLFEGASLRKLSGLQEVSFYKGMKILRPLLGFSKEELYALIQEKGLPFIEDYTNLDVKYLRARQRVNILPLVEERFGKKSFHHLARLARSMQDYERYMDRNIQKYRDLLVIGSFCSYIPLHSLYPLEFLEFEHFIRVVCEERGDQISHKMLMTLWEKVVLRQSNKKVNLQKTQIFLDRGILFFLPLEKQSLYKKEEIGELPYIFLYRGGIGKLEEETSMETVPCTWQNLLKGRVNLFLPEGPMELGVATLSMRFRGKSLKDLYSEKRIPIILRDIFPAFFQGETMVAHPILGSGLFEAKVRMKNCRLTLLEKKDFDSLK